MLPTLLLATLAATPAQDASPSADPVPVEPRESSRERIARALELGDAAPPGLYGAIAAEGSSDALRGLRRIRGRVATPTQKRRACEALAAFVGTRREDAALDGLERIARGDDPLDAIAAAHGLAACGAAAADRLRALAEEPPSPEVGAVALGAVLPALRFRNDPADLALVLRAWRFPRSGSWEAFARTVHALGRGRPESLARVLTEGHPSRLVALAVVDALARVDGATATRLLVDVARSTGGDVRLAALDALERRDVTGHVDALDRLFRESRSVDVRRAVLDVLVRGPADLPAWWERMDLAESDDPWLRAGGALALARSTAPSDHARLVELLRDPDWVVRDAAIAALVERRAPEAVPRLVRMMDREAAHRRPVVQEALVRLTGLDHGGAGPRWLRWWEVEGRAYELPSAAEAAALAEVRREARARSFYGIPVTADRVAFVIDTSGSMNDGTYSGATRLAVAQRELDRVLETLPAGKWFSLVFFAGAARPWRPGPTEMDERARRRARAHVARAVANGGTALYDALDAAWADPDIEAIYLLSDGEPSGGLVEDPDVIRADVRARAATDDVVVHCVSVGRTSALLRDLADATGGVYVEAR